MSKNQPNQKFKLMVLKIFDMNRRVHEIHTLLSHWLPIPYREATQTKFKLMVEFSRHDIHSMN